MSYRLRLLMRILVWLWRPNFDVTKEYRGEYRVWPTEAEMSVVENARFSYFLVLERFRFIFCSVMWKICMKRSWTAVMGAQIYKVKRPLHRWQRFSIITRPISWDEKWFYFEQRIESNGKLVCSAVVSCIFIAKDRKIPPQEVLQLMGVTHPSPPFSDAVKNFILAERSLERD